MSKKEYILTYPNMHYQSHIMEFLFTSLGAKFIRPPAFSERTKDLGRKLGREGFCQPLNNCIGDIYLAVEKGANCVIATEGVDSCRYGFYWVNQKVIIEEHFGIEVDFFPINHIKPKLSVQSILHTIGCSCTREKFDRVWLHTMEKINFITELTAIANRVRPKEALRGATSALYKKVIENLVASKELDNTRKIRKEGEEILLDVNKRNNGETSLRILLIGAIYEVLEPYANYTMEEYLSTLGVETQRSLSYQDLAPILDPSGMEVYLQNEDMMTRDSSKYLKRGLAVDGYGGYGKMTIAHAARAKRDGFDGIIHLHSFSCMPEIIAKAFIKKISEEEDIPAMSIVVEEISSKELFYSRLEAFVDLLREKKKRLKAAEIY